MSFDWTQALIIPSVGLILAFLGWYLRSSIETVRREREKLHDERRKIYLDVLDPYIRIFAGIKNPSETKKAMSLVNSFDYRRGSIEFKLIGSDRAVGASNNLMQHIYGMEADRESSEATVILRYWAGLLLAIRRDLGNAQTKLTEKDMLRDWFKDIDQVFPS